ncbi:MAG: hypothetical protein JL50_04195 [Peptococcaceae bacterium BICA1-7]|nr:MAG: hypothetical protein JL50_04195 [Peptococcaceae bacterium BICA1-7]
MKILKVERHSVDELLQRMRRVSMLTHPDIFVYRDSFISLECIRAELLSPPQSYILAGELQKVRNLRWQLKDFGVELFRLDGYVSIYLEGEDEPVDVLPPVVEESVEVDGTIHSIICDGMHRVSLSRMEWAIPQVVFIRGIPSDKPYYAYPVPGGWSQVTLREDLPDGFIKKWHRIKEYKTLYRNFNSAFNNVGGPRGRFTK